MALPQLERAVDSLFETVKELRDEITVLRIEMAILKTKIAFVAALCGIGGSTISLIVSHYWK